MAWKIEFLPEAAKELKKLDRTAAARILKTLEERIAVLDDPRTLGCTLVGEHGGYWRWRIGDYRVVAQIEDARVLILGARGISAGGLSVRKGAKFASPATSTR